MDVGVEGGAGDADEGAARGVFDGVRVGDGGAEFFEDEGVEGRGGEVGVGGEGGFRQLGEWEGEVGGGGEEVV